MWRVFIICSHCLFLLLQAENVYWMGWRPTRVTYTSDYFPELHAFAIELIKRGKVGVGVPYHRYFVIVSSMRCTGFRVPSVQGGHGEVQGTLEVCSCCDFLLRCVWVCGHLLTAHRLLFNLLTACAPVTRAPRIVMPSLANAMCDASALQFMRQPRNVCSAGLEVCLMLSIAQAQDGQPEQPVA